MIMMRLLSFVGSLKLSWVATISFQGIHEQDACHSLWRRPTMMDKAGVEPNSDRKRKIGNKIKAAISMGYYFFKISAKMS
jgi:hypothetical protein